MAPGRPSDRGSGAARSRPSAGRTNGWSSRTGCGLPKGAASKPPGELLELARPWSPEFIAYDLGRRGRRPIVPRLTRWSEAAEDIRGLRPLALDGPLAGAPESGDLLTAFLAAAEVKFDDAGNVRLVKTTARKGTARDDVAVAITLAAGAVARLPAPRSGPGYVIVR